ncbi:sensor histidine kinase [Arcobacter sp. CECT 8989]|uniref:sensor histidine kinase n=1 Tax=Arcobacter sp. CECT 8989 TaxID=2044509 RepID=UPI0013E938F8|nr:HAMP domain-containing sensor histidine kinase [Arcobacter sp. CECT 8989]
MEHKKIEIPYKPVWRFAMPVFEDSKRRGVIILNVFASFLLGELKKSNSFEIDIFDQDNHTLVSSKKNEWTRYLNLEKEINKKEFIYNNILFSGTSDEILYIGVVPKDSINSFIKLINFEIITLILIVFIISFLLAKALANIPKKLFDELEKQQKMLISQSKIAAMGEMTAMLAHQWRQPLNAISVLIQELEIKYSMKIINKQEFERISHSVNQKLDYMSKTIDGFRDFYKTQEKSESFNLVETIEKSFNIIQMKLKKSAIKSKITLLSGKKEDYFFFANENEIEQVFINIINNAIDAIDENCQENDKRFINVSLVLEDKKIEINFQDSGKGISNKVLDNLFEPYSSTKLEKNGTGLGLYMAKTIIEKNMKGKIFVENKELGASFRIILNR